MWTYLGKEVVPTFNYTQTDMSYPVIFFNQKIQQIGIFQNLGWVFFFLSFDFLLIIVSSLLTRMSQGKPSLIDEWKYMDLWIQVLHNYQHNLMYTLIAFLLNYRVQHWKYGMAY